MKRLLLVALAVFSLGILGAVFMPDSPTVFADAKADVCAGLDTAGSSANCGGGGPSVESIIKTVVSILSWLVGVVSIIMIIVGGFKYVTSGGDSGNVTSAKNTIIYALIGVIVAALAQVLVKYVLSHV